MTDFDDNDDELYEDGDDAEGLDAGDDDTDDAEAAVPRTRARLPVIAIVGRPNVGKSRLFNRVIGRREAIVEDTPGVTRDRNYGRGEWYGRPFTVIDTGGFEPESEDRLLEQMREQARLAMEEADAIVFVVDARAGLLPTDEQIAVQLRQTRKPVYVAANKLDTYELFAQAAEFYALGFEHVFALSAEHGPGFDDLMDAVTEFFPRVEPGAGGAESGEISIAVVGKPNAGKSTLINKLLGAERLLTSNIPGTTRDAIDSMLERVDPESGEVRQYCVIDTAGMRRKRAISQQLEKYSVIQAVKSLDRADVALLIIDATEGVSDQDAKIARLAMDRGCAMAILLNKWDAIEGKGSSTATEYRKAVAEALSFCDFAPVITVSALSGQRVHKVLDLVDRLYAAARVRVPTAELNRELQRMVSRHHAPMGRHRPVRFYYMSQVAVAPPTFVIQVNNPADVPDGYRRYLMNQMRELYGFEGSPVRLILRKPAGRHRWDEKG